MLTDPSIMANGKLVPIMVIVGLLGIGVGLVGSRWLDGKLGFGLPFPGDKDSEIGQLDRLPQFQLPGLDGQEVASSRWAGEILVLNFWATWCPPCLRELPLFDALQRTHAEAGLQVVGIAIDNQGDVERFLAEHPVGFLILLGDMDAIELSRRLGNRVQGLPFTAIFDPRGRRVYAHSGEVTRAALTEQLEPLLAWFNRERTTNPHE